VVNEEKAALIVGEGVVDSIIHIGVDILQETFLILLDLFHLLVDLHHILIRHFLISLDLEKVMILKTISGDIIATRMTLTTEMTGVIGRETETEIGATVVIGVIVVVTEVIAVANVTELEKGKKEGKGTEIIKVNVKVDQRELEMKETRIRKDISPLNLDQKDTGINQR
jgi:hypothetical protein